MSATGDTWTVLIVDDSPDDRTEARRLLLTGSDRRYTFDEAQTGAAAVQAVLAVPPDCLLLDYHLPDLDASDVLTAITGPDGLPVCPVVVLTGSAGTEMGRRVLRAGAQDYISKDGLTADCVTRATENAVERYAMARELRSQARQTTFRLALVEALRPLVDPKAVQVTAARVLGRHLGANRVVYAEVESDGVVLVAPGYADGVAHIPGRYRLDDFGPVLGREYGAGRPVVAADVRVDPGYTDAERTHYAGIGVVANLGVPLLKDGRLVSILSAHQSVPRRWTADEVALVAETAEATWAAVQRARAEAALRESEHRLRLAMEAAGTGMWDWNVTTDAVVWSQECYAILGMKEEEFEGTAAAFGRLLHPDDSERVWAAVREAVDTRTKYECEFRLVRPSGDIRWVNNHGRAVYDESGTPVRMTGTITDITDRKQAEQQVRAREEQLRLAVEAASAGYWSWDARSNRSSWDDQYHALYGFAPDQPRDFETWASSLHPDDRGRVLDRLDQMRATVGDDQWRMEFRSIHRWLGVRWHDGRGRCERDETGALVRITGIDLDITVRKQAEEALRASAEREHEAARHKDEFIAVLAHELRNPLAPIRTSVAVLRATGPSDPTLAKCRDIIDRQVAQMARLLDDLSTYPGSPAERSRFNAGPCASTTLSRTPRRRSGPSSTIANIRWSSSPSIRRSCSMPMRPVWRRSSPTSSATRRNTRTLEAPLG